MLYKMVVVTVNKRNDIPYGVFSSGYKNPFNINEENWSSIINYVVGRFSTGVPRLQEPYDINLDVMWEELEKTMINKAIQKAIDAKSLVDPEFEGVLLSSETRPILYISDDHYLGADMSTKQGENIYGKWLTNYRNLLMDNNSEVFYNVYVLDRFLKTAINHESLENYLDLARQGVGMRHLIASLREKYGNMVDIPSREIVEDTRAFTVKDFTFKPEEIILNVMKTKIRSVRVQNLNKYKQDIFMKFIKNVIKKSNQTYTPAEFIRKMSTEEREAAVERVFEGYVTQVKDNIIEEDVPKYYIPTKEDIDRIEDLKVEGYNQALPFNQSYAFVDSKTSRLRLKDDRVVITVDNLSFPSIAHYIIYMIGTLIENFEPYNMIYDHTNNSFFRYEDSKRYLDENISKFKESYFTARLVDGIRATFDQNPYLKDFIKSLGDSNTLSVRDYNVITSSAVWNDLKNSLDWRNVMNKQGDVIDYIDSDDFFVFVQKEMLESFLNILTIVSPGNYCYNMVTKVYEQFYGNLDKTPDNNWPCNCSNISTMASAMGISIDEQSCEFLKSKFVSRIMAAQELAKRRFRTNVIYMTKFVIIECRLHIFRGLSHNPKMVYKNIYSKEFLATAKVMNYIAACNNVRTIQEDHVNRAFDILNTNSNILYLTGETMVKPAIDKDGNQYFSVQDSKSQVGEGQYSSVQDSKAQVGEGQYFSAQEQDKNPEENEVHDIEDEEEEVQGYAEANEEDDEIDDLMYAPDNTNFNADSMAKYIFKNLNISKNITQYIDSRVKELYNSQVKNIYRINLWSS